MPRLSASATLAMLFLLGLVAACGSAGPAATPAPTDCGLGLSADEQAFARRFRSVDFATGRVEDGERVFRVDQGPQLDADPLAPVQVRVCVQKRERVSSIVWDGTVLWAPGGNRTQLSAVERGSYVIRLGVDGVLVKNLTFTVR